MGVPYPIGSMYAIYGNIYHQYTPNVSIYIYIYHTWILWAIGILHLLGFETTTRIARCLLEFLAQDSSPRAVDEWNFSAVTRIVGLYSSSCPWGFLYPHTCIHIYIYIIFILYIYICNIYIYMLHMHINNITLQTWYDITTYSTHTYIYIYLYII